MTLSNLGVVTPPWPGRQSYAGHLPSLMAGTHLQLRRLRQRKAKSLAEGHTTLRFELQFTGLRANTVPGRLLCF